MFKILPDDIDKIFYIDGDIIVNTDLSVLYDELKDEKIASVVVEPLAMQHRKTILSHCYELRCFSNFKKNCLEYPYFNAGFMLINMKLAKKLDIFQQFMDIISIYKNLPYADQDLLNAVIGQKYADKINYLDPSYNVFCNMNYREAFNDAFYDENIIKASFKKPKIFHYGGSNKPWYSTDVMHHYNIWWKYCKISPYKKLYKQANKIIAIIQNEKYKIYKFGSIKITLRKQKKIDEIQDKLLKIDESLKQLFDYCNFLSDSAEVMQSVILESYLKNNINSQFENYSDFINYLFNAKKIVSASWTPNIDDVFAYFKFVFQNSEFEMIYNDKVAYADIYAFWGTRAMPYQLSIIKNAILNRKNIVIFEMGFISTIYSNIANYSQNISFMFDDLCPYYDGRFKSRLEELLEDKKVVIDKEKIGRARKLINHIIKNKLTKYNHQPIYKPNIGSADKKKVLVVDQAFGDMSIYKGLANKDTFKYMLEKAVNDNPNYDIIIKSHPDSTSNLNNSYYSKDDLKDNVYLMSEEINPISLLEIVDKVYVCSSQLGFEALMMGKEVHVFGLPFYAGFGLTVDYQKCGRRTNKRSIEEIFYIAYIMYTYYVNPEKKERCEIEDALDYLIKLRKEYFTEFNIRCDDKDLLCSENQYHL